MNEIRLITNHLLRELIDAIDTATSINLIVSFVSNSGVALLHSPLKLALQRGTEIKILVGDYLYITDPDGLDGLLNLGEDAEIRLWQSRGRSFHPKAYLLQSNDEGTLFVGSSNLTGSALTHGIEWNLAMEARVAPITFATARQKFIESFYDSCTIPITRESILQYRVSYEEYHRTHPYASKQWMGEEIFNSPYRDKESNSWIAELPATYKIISPRPVQSEALEELMGTMEEGYDKAMVVMATGLGKTFLAAFLAQKFSRVLFVAHREEILLQASRAFQQVMPERTIGLYNGHTKSLTSDTLFASIFTLAMKQRREAFAPEDFDLIIIDEFHHAAARSYRKLLDYFRPKFLLGITATPERSDGQDIFGLCDGNVAYQIRFPEAIENGWLSPFHYYGIYDHIDYTSITWLGSHYGEDELYAAQIHSEVGFRVFEAWKKHRGSRTLAFCSSIRQSDYLSQLFIQNGIQAISLHSHTADVSRQEVIHRLSQGLLDILFTVDLFNEGIDIPSVDTLLFIRPTESLTVFVQQIGRGLRLHPGKSHCTIIDLIGNYRNADIKLRVFDLETNAEKARQSIATVGILPSNCSIELDTRVIHLLQELSFKRLPRQETLRMAYIDLKVELGRRPTYLEFHLFGNADIQVIRQEFRSYIGFLDWQNELTQAEKEIYTLYKGWLQEVEKTIMTRSYKMVMLSYILSRGDTHWLKPVTADQVASYFYNFLTEKEYRKKIDLTKELWIYNEQKITHLIARMPMSKWASSSEGWISFKAREFQIEIHDESETCRVLHEWTQQICEYRLHLYFERKQLRVRRK